MKVLGLQLERSSEHERYVVLFDNAHGIDIEVSPCAGMWRASARIGGLVIGAPIRSTPKEAAAALDAGLRALWGAMAAIMKERVRA